MRTISIALLSMIAALMGGVLCILVYTRDYETIGLGLLAGLLLVPSIILFTAMHHFWPETWFKLAGYWLSWLVIFGFFVSIAWLDSRNEVSDGSGAMAQLICFGLLVAAPAAYYVLRHME